MSMFKVNLSNAKHFVSDIVGHSRVTCCHSGPFNLSVVTMKHIENKCVHLNFGLFQQQKDLRHCTFFDN